MTFTYDTSTDLGRVRLMIPDRVEAEAIFTDEELTSFIALETDVRRSTALALETIASDQALVLKVMALGDVSTNGAAVAKALMDRAAQLRVQALEAEAAEDGGTFDVIEMVPNTFAYRNRVYNEMLRNQ